MVRRPTARLRYVALVVAAGVLAACGGGGGGGDSVGSGRAPDHGRVVALGEEYLLADLLALGIKPVASTANVVMDEGFAGLDGLDTDGIEPLPSTEPNIEKLASLRPDVVVAATFVVDRLGRDVFEGLGRLVVVPDDDPAARLLAVGDAFDAVPRARELIDDLDAATARARRSLAAGGRPVSVATVYPGPTVAAWVDGPIDIPDTILSLGFTISPSADDVRGEEDGRLYLSREQVGLLDADTLVAVQSDLVDGEQEALDVMADDPLWTRLPAVAAGRVVTVDRLGYPGIAGRRRLVDDLARVLG